MEPIIRNELVKQNGLDAENPHPGQINRVFSLYSNISLKICYYLLLKEIIEIYKDALNGKKIITDYQIILP
jgi:hypothetical protein